MHPLLQGVYRNARNKAWTLYKGQKGDKLRYNLGSRFNLRLMDCIIDDQLPLTEVSLARLNMAQVLVEHNKRFRLTFKEFKEIYAACRERLREAVQRREPRLLELLRRHLPSIRPELYDDEKGATKILFNSRVMTFLLADFSGLAAKLQGNSVLKAEVALGKSWGEVLSDYLDVLQAVKRSEVVDLVRQAVIVAGPEQSDAQRRERFDEGRLYRFHPGVLDGGEDPHRLHRRGGTESLVTAKRSTLSGVEPRDTDRQHGVREPVEGRRKGPKPIEYLLKHLAVGRRRRGRRGSHQQDHGHGDDAEPPASARRHRS